MVFLSCSQEMVNGRMMSDHKSSSLVNTVNVKQTKKMLM